MQRLSLGALLLAAALFLAAPAQAAYVGKIVDAKTVVLGSFNFSQNAEEENDENLLVVDDAFLAQQFQAEFGRVYDQAKAAKK